MSKNPNILEHCVRESLEQYLADLGEGGTPHDMWEMVMRCVEKPVLEVALQHAQGNQSRAAEYLGMTRNTLRKKLLAHQLLD
ncbi:MAG: helix-turn-helix domain-containing protein [Corticimicrobacter sp.]|uniref:helix-turn-helix domain-containing protein n=1 Tax=Corticimicrobacter sp. TaxID=2678536 RepID=UPI00117FECD4|nr:Fis family transcriptional regulator [Alcaligenaceae bacterium SJ-26]